MTNKTFIILASLICLLLSSCGTKPTGDVVKDTEYLTSQIIDLTEASDTAKLNKVIAEYQSYYENRKATKLEYYGRLLQLMGSNINPSYNSNNSELNQRLSSFLQTYASDKYVKDVIFDFGKRYMLTFISDNFSGVAQNDAAIANSFIQFAYAIGALYDFFDFYVDKYQHNTPEETYIFCNLIQASNYAQQFPKLFELYTDANNKLIEKYNSGQLDASRYPDLYRVIGNVSELQISLQNAAKNYYPNTL